MKKTILAVIALASISAVCNAKVKLSSLVGDNMVLQQQAGVRLWGTAKAGATVTVTPSWSDKTSQAKADHQGRWQLSITTPKAGFTPYEISFSDGNKAEDVKARNVLVGEVWMAAGQSNMEMPLKGFDGCCIKDGMKEAIDAARVREVRMFTVPKRQSYTPQADCGGAWQTTANFNQVKEFSATAYHFAKMLTGALHVPVGIVTCAYGGTRVESWMPKEQLQKYPDIPTDSASIARYTPDYQRAMLMYNGMFRAAQRYTVRGIIWYQGCSNVDSYATYACRLRDMVQLWRAEMGLGDIPFYFAEIAPYDYGSGGSLEQKGALLREQQFKAISMIPNSGMISTNNTVEPYERFNIHPQDKQTVGERFAYMALNKTYGYKDICCEGPTYKSLTIKNNEAWVSFDNLRMGICRNYDIRGFELAGEDKKFYAADEATLHWQTNEVVLKSGKVPHPVAVRYCFRDFQPGTLYGGNRLPAVPFRTDNW